MGIGPNSVLKSREFLETTCRQAHHTPSHVVQAALQKGFGFLVSIGHLNRVRAELGVGSRTPHRGKRQFPCSSEGPNFQEGAGGILLVAATKDTGLLSTLETALSSCPLEANSRFAHLSSASLRMLVLTLLSSSSRWAPSDLGFTGLHR
jgi:hypothetical protein